MLIVLSCLSDLVRNSQVLASASVIHFRCLCFAAAPSVTAQLAQLQQWAVADSASGGSAKDDATRQRLLSKLTVLLPRQRTVTFDDLC